MKRVVLVSFGLIFAAGYAGCLPADSGGGTGTAGHPGTAGTGTPGNAGTSGGTAGDMGTAGTQGGTAGDMGTAGTQGGTAGDMGTAGTQGGTAGDMGTAGTQGGTAGSTGGSVSTGGRGGTTGTGGGGRGGTTGTAGTGGTSRGGTTGTAGTGGTSRGGTTGTAGAGGTAGTTGTGGTAGNLLAVASTLDGQMLLGPCMRDTEASVCATVNGSCPDTNNSDIALRGVKTTDRTITLGGTAGVTYTIVLHVQGEVESKDYTGGMDQNSSGSSPNLDGWRVGGTPSTGNAYNVYLLRVTNPGSTTTTTYYLNSLAPPGVQNHTTYGLNYTTPASGALAFTAQGGAMIRIVAADSNCSMIKNCGPAVSGATCLSPIIIQNIEPTSVTKNASFNFNTAYNGQFVVLTVKSVTQN